MQANRNADEWDDTQQKIERKWNCAIKWHRINSINITEKWKKKKFKRKFTQNVREKDRI